MKRETYPVEGLREAAKVEWTFMQAKAARNGEDAPEPGKLERIKNQITGKTELLIRGYVYWGMAEELEEMLAEGEPDTLLVRINSGGGSAYTGLEIANRLRGIECEVTTRNESAAMSAAAVIFLGGDHREVGSMGTTTMFHGARGFIDILEFGPVEELEKVDVQKTKEMELDVLRSLDKSIRKMLLDNTSMDEETVDECLKLERNLTNEDCLEYGIATAVYEKKGVKAAADEDGGDEDGDEEEKPMDEESRSEPEKEPEPREGEKIEASASAAADEKPREASAQVEMSKDSRAEPTASAASEAGSTESGKDEEREADEGGGSLFATIGSVEEVLLCS